MKHYNNNSGYSIVISLLMVGFLIVVTSGVFNLVLGELNDNRGRENYMKAFAGAEGALELALLQIKEKGYGYYGSEAISIDNDILAKDPLNPKRAIEAKVSYNLNSKVTTYAGTLDPLGYAIVPLFYIDDAVAPSIELPVITVQEISVTPSVPASLIWNLLGEDDGISGIGSVTPATSVADAQLRDFVTGNYEFKDITISEFLTDGNDRKNKPIYMILFNSDPNSTLDYTISSPQPFTSPETKIISSAQVGKYKQNLSTTLDNTEFLNILRYSIYSN